MADAGLNTWTTYGPPGASIGALALDPQYPQTLYAGTARAGVFKSTDGAASWKRFDTGLPADAFVDALAVDPVDATKLYLAARQQGPFISTDAGSSWTQATSGLDNVDVAAFAVDRSKHTTVYAAVEAGKVGVYKTTDGGKSWANINKGLPEGAIFDVAVDPDRPSTLYAATQDGLFKSTNDGNRWAPVGGLKQKCSATTMVAAVGRNPTRLYVGDDCALFSSTDSGTTWRTIANDWPFGALVPDQTQDNTLYASRVGGMHKSTDSGATWSELGAGIDWGWGHALLLVDPVDRTTLYAASRTRGVFKSTDEGKSWEAASAGLVNSAVNAIATDPNSPNTVYAGTEDGGVSKSTDGGRTWSEPCLNSTIHPSVETIAIHPTRRDTLYLGTERAEFETTDGGSTWQPAPAGSLRLVEDVVMGAGKFMYGTARGGVVTSSDGGDTWKVASAIWPKREPIVIDGEVEPQRIESAAVFAIAADPVVTGVLFAGTDGDGVFKSTDAGVTWTPLNTGLVDPIVLTLAIAPADPNTLYAGTDSGVFKLATASGTWQPASTGLTDTHIRQLATDPSSPKSLYAVTEKGALFQTGNGGASWLEVGTTPPAAATRRALSPDNATVQYAYGQGLFRSTDGGTTWQTVAALAGMFVSPFVIDGTTPTTLYARALVIDSTGPAAPYARTTSARLFKSLDAGSTWTAIEDGIIDPPVTVSIATLAIDRSSAVYAVAGYDQGRRYIAGTFKSVDGGVRWTPLDDVVPIAVDPEQQSTVYATSSREGIVKSTDGGQHWGPTNFPRPGTPPDAALTIAFDPATPKTVYAGALYGVFKSTDGAVTWKDAGGLNSSVLALAIDPTTPEIVYAGVNRQPGRAPENVFKSTDGGTHWTNSSSGLPDTSIRALVIDPLHSSSIYAGTDGGGVFESTNSGSDWHAMNSGLYSLRVEGLAMSSRRPNVLYAATWGGGVQVFEKGAPTPATP